MYTYFYKGFVIERAKAREYTIFDGCKPWKTETAPSLRKAEARVDEILFEESVGSW